MWLGLVVGAIIYKSGVIPLPEGWIRILEACVPILVALIGIIPTIISSRKKTEETIKKTNASIAAVQKTLDDHIKEDEDARAKEQRYRILRFYDEMCEGKNHSESHFEDVLDDIDDYEAYCKSHPEFKNNRGEIAMEYIKEVFKKLKKQGGFLTHKEE